MAFSTLKPDPLRVEGNVIENLETFRKNLGPYFLANKTWNKRRETQVAGLLNLMDEDTLLLYYSLDISRSSDATVDDILNAIEDYFVPKDTIAETVKFMNRVQEPGEPFDEYLDDLKKLLPFCRFGAHEKKLLAAQIVRGLSSKIAQSYLLQNELSLELVLAFCRNHEITERACRRAAEENRRSILQTKQRRFIVVKSKPKQKKLKKCGRCKENHPYAQCPAFYKRCYFCEKMGHLAKCCRSRTDLFNSDSDSEEEEDMQYLGTITVDTGDSKMMETMETVFSSFRQDDERETTHIIRDKGTTPKEVVKPSDEGEKSNMCDICYSKPQDGLFVHNSIAHVYGCYDCAKKIFNSSGNCPICRRTTLKVTKLFVP